jgi:hypothetical protein
MRRAVPAPSTNRHPHCRESQRDEIAAAFAAVAEEVDAILLAGDLTTHAHPEQALILADACRPLRTPALPVLGKHDWPPDCRHASSRCCSTPHRRFGPRSRDLRHRRHQARRRGPEGVRRRLARIVHQPVAALMVGAAELSA